MSRTKELAQEYLDKGMYRVTDVEEVRRILKRGEHTSQKTYDAFTRVIAETGTLLVLFRDHPKVKELL